MRMSFAYSPKGCTANEPGMAWLQHFDNRTRDRVSGEFRLLLLDGVTVTVERAPGGTPVLDG